MATEKRIVFTTKLVEEATEKLNDGVILKRVENPWLKGEVGLRRQGVSFRMTKEEQQEYIKCALDVSYFAGKYCKTKREDGTIGEIKLRDYQIEVIDNFINNRFNILMASRQVGKCVDYNTLVEVELDNEIISIRIGKLFYDMLSKYRKLTILERIKIKLYDVINFFEKN